MPKKASPQVTGWMEMTGVKSAWVPPHARTPAAKAPIRAMSAMSPGVNR